MVLISWLLVPMAPFTYHHYFVLFQIARLSASAAPSLYFFRPDSDRAQPPSTTSARLKRVAAHASLTKTKKQRTRLGATEVKLRWPPLPWLAHRDLHPKKQADGDGVYIRWYPARSGDYSDERFHTHSGRVRALSSTGLFSWSLSPYPSAIHARDLFRFAFPLASAEQEQLEFDHLEAKYHANAAEGACDCYRRSRRHSRTREDTYVCLNSNAAGKARIDGDALWLPARLALDVAKEYGVEVDLLRSLKVTNEKQVLPSATPPVGATGDGQRISEDEEDVDEVHGGEGRACPLTPSRVPRRSCRTSKAVDADGSKEQQQRRGQRPSQDQGPPKQTGAGPLSGDESASGSSSALSSLFSFDSCSDSDSPITPRLSSSRRSTSAPSPTGTIRPPEKRRDVDCGDSGDSGGSSASNNANLRLCDSPDQSKGKKDRKRKSPPNEEATGRAWMARRFRSSLAATTNTATGARRTETNAATRSGFVLPFTPTAHRHRPARSKALLQRLNFRSSPILDGLDVSLVVHQCLTAFNEYQRMPEDWYDKDDRLVPLNFVHTSEMRSDEESEAKVFSVHEHVLRFQNGLLARWILTTLIRVVDGSAGETTP